jgi:hypothetical protein
MKVLKYQPNMCRPLTSARSKQKPQETCVLMTEGLAGSAFDLTSARPDTAHQRLARSPKRLHVGLEPAAHLVDVG